MSHYGIPFQRPYHHIYVDFGNRDEADFMAELASWLNERDHWICSCENVWKELLPHQTHANHGKLLGKWFGLVKRQKGTINPKNYDPEVLAEFKKVWGKK